MSTTLTLDGTTLTLPTANDLSWDTNLNNTVTAIVNKANATETRLDTLETSVPSAGVAVLSSLTSTTANPAAAGSIRLAKTDTVSWRNNGNTADNALGTSSDRLQFGGVNIPTISSIDILSNKTLSAPTFSGTPAGIDISGKSLINGKLVCSVASSALTIALKTTAGNDPSAADPVLVYFRDPALTTGGHTVLSVTAATSLVISSGSTMGAANSTPFRVWVVGFNDSSTFRLGAINCLNGSSIRALSDDTLESSTAEGGAGAADSPQVIYTGTAVTTKPMRVLGYLEYSSGLATAGTWASAPTKVQPYHVGVPLPGDRIQSVRSSSGAVATGTSLIPFDDTIPQNTEGDQYMTQAITPVSAVNLLEIEHDGYYANSTTDASLVAALFQDTTANALAVGWGGKTSAANAPAGVHLRYSMRSGTTSATTFKIRAGNATAGTTTFNGALGGRLYGGTFNSVLSVTEYMG